ncbi:glycosyltransferase family 4 protein [Chloroflexota bacterium]
MKIAVLGNLANIGYRMTKCLCQRGVEADLYLHPGDAQPSWEDDNIDGGWIKTYGQKHLNYPFRPVRTSAYIVEQLNLLRRLSCYDIVQKVCGGLSPLELAYFRLTKRPYAILATGSDLRELARQDSRAARRTLASFREARVLFLATPDLVETASDLKLSNWVYLPNLVDAEKYYPFEYQLDKSDFEMVFFHPSRLDWSYTGGDRILTVLKYNDRFIRAFARYVGEGNNSLATIVDWGVDRERTKDLVHELGIESNVEFIPPMPKSNLINYYNGADVVVDQFGAGWFGLVALEAMSCAKPVMAYVKNQYSAVYPEAPPILNCQTEDEIYRQLLKASDKQYREQLGRQSREWILKYHHWEKVIDKLISHYETILGRSQVEQ